MRSIKTESKEIQCKDVGCVLKGYWVGSENGVKKLCFKAPHNRETHTIKLDLETVEKLLAPVYEKV